MKRFHFSVREMVLVVALAAVAVCWLIERRALTHALESEIEHRRMAERQAERAMSLLDDMREMSPAILESL